MNRLERFAVGKEPLNGGYPHVTLPLLIGGGVVDGWRNGRDFPQLSQSLRCPGSL
jgi:hypothetical protein